MEAPGNEKIRKCCTWGNDKGGRDRSHRRTREKKARERPHSHQPSCRILEEKSKAVTFSRRMDVSTVMSMRSCTYSAPLTALHETCRFGGCRTCRLVDAAAEAFREEAALAVGVAQRQDVDQLLRRAVEGQACNVTEKKFSGLPTAIVACHWP